MSIAYYICANVSEHDENHEVFIRYGVAQL
jgi:hypothetical protein